MLLGQIPLPARAPAGSLTSGVPGIYIWERPGTDRSRGAAVIIGIPATVASQYPAVRAARLSQTGAFSRRGQGNGEGDRCYPVPFARSGAEDLEIPQ